MLPEPALPETGVQRYRRVTAEREARIADWRERAALLPSTPPPAPYMVDIIVPTMDNKDKLVPMLATLIDHTAGGEHLFRIKVINNGTPGYVGRVIGQHPFVEVIEAGKNLGWEGAIHLGASRSTAPILGMFNDDIHIVPGNPGWLSALVDSFYTIPKCGSVGPCSNVVMQKQNMLYLGLDPKPYYTSLLIGFCVLYRRDLFDAIGGMPMGMPGGDDLDLSIRVEQAGFKPVMRRDVFVYHHGFSTGTRLHGDYWNSIEMQEKTRMALIQKHGVSAYLRCINSFIEEIPL